MAYTKVDFPVRQTRSGNKCYSQQQSKLNISYTTLVCDDNVNDSQVNTTDITTDLRNKLVEAENYGRECDLKILQLQNIIKEKDIKLTILDDKLNYYLSNKNTLCNAQIQTETIRMVDVSTESNIDSVHPKMMEVAECFTQTDNAIQVLLQDNTTNTNLTSKTKKNLLKSKLNVKSKPMFKKVDKLSSHSASNIPVSSSSVKPKFTPRITPRILIVSDQLGREVCGYLKGVLSHNFSICSTIKSNDLHENIIDFTKSHINDFTKSDFTIVLLSSYHVHSADENDISVRNLKTKLLDLMQACSNTNLILSTIPYRKDTHAFNNVIYSINNFIETELFKRPSTLTLYINKILNFSDDYHKNGVDIKFSGMKKFTKIIGKYVMNELSDDRVITQIVPPKQNRQKNGILAPSKIGSTNVPLLSKRTTRQKK